jgi:LPXTG-site transpeptidase (sortase) family protein
MRRSHTAPNTRLRSFNNGLSIIVVFLSLYIAATPLVPGVLFWWKIHFGSKPALVAANSASQPNKPTPPEVIPADNTLVIPRLEMQQIIYDGPDARTLRKGVWHRPHTGSPDQGSNTVLVGHRFTYDGPAIFYNLDKVQTGDSIVIYWNHQKYSYKVAAVEVVPPTAIEIEAPTNDPLLTIYTCTPLWTAKNRLVIKATLMEKKS